MQRLSCGPVDVVGALDCGSLNGIGEQSQANTSCSCGAAFTCPGPGHAATTAPGVTVHQRGSEDGKEEEILVPQVEDLQQQETHSSAMLLSWPLEGSPAIAADSDSAPNYSLGHTQSHQSDLYSGEPDERDAAAAPLERLDCTALPLSEPALADSLTKEFGSGGTTTRLAGSLSTKGASSAEDAEEILEGTSSSSGRVEVASSGPPEQPAFYAALDAEAPADANQQKYDATQYPQADEGSDADDSSAILKGAGPEPVATVGSPADAPVVIAQPPLSLGTACDAIDDASESEVVTAAAASAGAVPAGRVGLRDADETKSAPEAHEVFQPLRNDSEAASAVEFKAQISVDSLVIQDTTKQSFGEGHSGQRSRCRLRVSFCDGRLPGGVEEAPHAMSEHFRRASIVSN